MSTLAICASTFFGCLFGSVVPVINAELLLLSMSALAAADLVVPLIVLATTGQMVGKTALFLAGRGALRIPLLSGRRAEQARARFADRPAIGGTLLFASAAAGVPPFYLVSVASGMLGMELRRFVLLGVAGRFLRFSLIVLFPQVVKGLAS